MKFLRKQIYHNYVSVKNLKEPIHFVEFDLRVPECWERFLTCPNCYRKNGKYSEQLINCEELIVTT